MSSCTQMLRAHVRSVANFPMVAMLFVFVLVWTSRWELKGTEKARAMQVEKLCCGPASLGEDTQTLCHTGHQAHSPGGPSVPWEAVNAHRGSSSRSVQALLEKPIRARLQPWDL